ncbi:uncharacterized protein LOC128202123 [Galleria mellonella]|uniref:Uncharacterized protein LOC128202123 n=1 Tax=Galleria mellonella TaxID=7137 RepID=A0ABM3N0W4_GALME|nr:uncharacterized protein LOC128202123 [Galleria mellonella]
MSDDEFSDSNLVDLHKLNDLKKLRGTVKGRLTLFEKYISKYKSLTLTKMQITEISLRIDTITQCFNNYCDIQNQIDVLVDKKELENQLEYRELIEEQYYSNIAAAKCLIEVDKNTNSNCSQSIISKPVALKLPEIKLMCFDGSYDLWLEFRNSYITMIHERTDLDAIQKLHYLKSSLSGCALQVISALEFTASNYNHAWELLENRFHNNRLLVYNHVRSLFSASSVTKESPLQIRKLIDTILRNLRALQTLGEPTDSWDTLVIYLVLTKLDANTEREWENHKGSISSDPNNKLKLDDLLNFLRNKADMLEVTLVNHKVLANKPILERKPVHDSKRYSNHSQFTHSYVTTRTNNSKLNNKRIRNCIMCSENHALYTCISFLNLSVKNRIKLIDDKKLCQNCLRSGHTVNECIFGACKRCNKKHNSLIHTDGEVVASALADRAHYSLPADNARRSSTALHSQTNNTGDLNTTLFPMQQVLLCTALVDIFDGNKRCFTIRALLDNGSQHSFISNQLFQQLNISSIQSTIRITGVGQSLTQSNKICEVNIRSKVNDYKMRVQCMVLPCITSTIPSKPMDYKSLRIPDNIQLADPTFNEPSAIDLLIGADLFWDILYENRIRLPSGPFLQNSKLGWLISGSIHSDSSCHGNPIQCNLSQAIDTQLKRFWELEEVTITNKLFTEDEHTCEHLFDTTTKRNADGRFLVRIPLQQSADHLGDSYALAKSRFLSLERKLERLPFYKKLYYDFIHEYVELGHMTKVDEYNKPYYFLPHHGVLREHSTTTKLRVVFDASAVTTSNKSLNDIQYVGPPLQNDIFSILLRFRQYKFVASADVEKMFRQILIQTDQRNLQLIVWRENPSDPLSIYRLNTVTYGTASAPYLSMRCLKQLAIECGDDMIAKIINEDFYVDDLITGHDDKQILLEICNKVSQVLSSGCFTLRKWTFSHDVKTSSSKELCTGDHCQNKTLGIGWYNTSDELHFTTAITESHVVTKRTILSILSQIYDPLGLLTPVIIIAKILLQHLWLCKIHWDDTVPENIKLNWEKFINSLKSLHELRIPRYIMSDNNEIKELHIFTDASQNAYGACAYIRTYNKNINSPVTIKLLCAKSKVSPIKPVTIPRLELCGALLGARLYKKIVSSLRLKFDKVYFWTDSTIVMGWVRMSPHLLKTFVQHRVTEINELTGDAIWLHVNGKNNPADLASRGAYLDILVDCTLWWHGPTFLHGRQFNCKVDHSTYTSIELPEVKNEIVCAASNIKDSFINFSRFSSFERLKRTGAYVLRFITNIRSPKHLRTTGSLSVDELSASITMLARLEQIQSFPDEYDSLLKQLPLNQTKSNKVSGLNIFLDQSGLIRVGGRLRNSRHFDYNKKHPILISSKNYFSTLLFRDEHKRLLHAGPQLLLSTIRENWWPLAGRNLARKVVRQCVTCVRMRGKTLTPIMGDLPSERLEPGYPFMRCGVDYAGPVMILNRRGRGAALMKGYICIFVCFTTRAIHLELVSSLSTNDYLLALKRFISRRGKPIEIFSDNGKVFVGSQKELSLFLNENATQIEDFTTNNGIKLRFIPPYAPHFGGLWEIGVRFCKHHIRRVVGNSNLTFEEFTTVLTQIEAILNSRPMYPLSSDPNDFLPLTPSHFLIGRPLTALPCKDLTSTATHRLMRYDRIEQMRQHFWQRWSKEYVSELQTRTKWKVQQPDIGQDTLVLIKEDNLPPLKWRMGRILRTFPGKDGVSRVAEIRTATGIIQRATSKICPLPPQPSDAE